MGHIISRSTWRWVLAVSLAAAFAAVAEGDVSVKKTPKKLHGRLPAYYRLVVSEEQRMEIYRIQAEYKDRIQSLQDQLKELKHKRDARIVSVLTEEQKKQVEEAATKAKAKKAAHAKKKAAAKVENDATRPSTATLPAQW